MLFLGDNAMNHRFGQMDGGTATGNIAALDRALSTEDRVFVPGHGRTGGREVAEVYRDYLTRLKSEVAKHYEEGMSDFEMKPLVIEAMGPFRDWVDFDRNIGRHISLVYLEVEAEQF